MLVVLARWVEMIVTIGLPKDELPSGYHPKSRVHRRKFVLTCEGDEVRTAGIISQELGG